MQVNAGCGCVVDFYHIQVRVVSENDGTKVSDRGGRFIVCFQP